MRRRGIGRRSSNGDVETAPLWQRLKLHWWLTGLIFAVALVWLSMPLKYQPIDVGQLKLNEPSPYTITSPISFSYLDSEATRRRKAEIEAETPPVFDIDRKSQIDDLNHMFEVVKRVRSLQIPRRDKIERMANDLIIGDYLSLKTREILVDTSDDDIDGIRDRAASIMSKILDRGIVPSQFAQRLKSELGGSRRWRETVAELRSKLERQPSDMEIAARMPVEIQPDGNIIKAGELYLWAEAVEAVQREIERLGNYPFKDVVGEIVRNLIRPNVSFDPKLTAQRRKAAAAAVKDVYKQVSKGEQIVSKGEKLTRSDLDKLTMLSKSQRGFSFTLMVGVALLVVALLLSIVYYILKFEPEILDEYRKLMTICLSVLLIMGIGRLIIRYGSNSLPMPELLVPTAITSAITAVLVSPHLAMLVTVMIGVLLSVMCGKTLEIAIGYFAMVFIGGMVAIYALSKLRHRRELIVAGFYVSIANIALALSLSLLQSEGLNVMIVNLLSGMASGLTVAFLTPGLLPFFEYIAQTTTEIKLLELSDLKNPILAELERVAQGTYYHSINVAKLAEAAAEEIGANPLLVRVGAYYHDIGKMRHPLYFIENQNGENIHDRIGPAMSARIIISHVKDGVEIAKQEKLPKIVQNIIQQHHGTSLITYFYHKALKGEKSVNEEDYRYPGPKPQTKEAALIMLADSVESAVRSTFTKGNPSYNEIRELVQNVIAQKVEDDQLDESNLTLKDIKDISDTFIKATVGMFHQRIEYPQLEVREDEVIPIDSARRRRKSDG
ncbi:HDIG domain-containing protein [Candidatus Poribacteria bacterium]|nr:HDIG domain-containing protein [Candidatus Poribacteria bacterium]